MPAATPPATCHLQPQQQQCQGFHHLLDLLLQGFLLPLLLLQVLLPVQLGAACAAVSALPGAVLPGRPAAGAAARPAAAPAAAGSSLQQWQALGRSGQETWPQQQAERSTQCALIPGVHNWLATTLSNGDHEHNKGQVDQGMRQVHTDAT